ncbi:iron chaperone [Alteribacter lacisalsi]|uniref:Iron chaperone n=1 Tax=Alteribacter lacisalsi TaxID=2045244 RepID=A0A2W0HRC7_9BACI|nr:iron chaperone [Alteribacter lacisalsi]PYZ96148.1 iron chaperone [Alteribacter lacisalsi]
METFEEFIQQIDHPDHRDRMEEVLGWVKEKYPQLEEKIAWKQPMFTDHGTFILGFSVSKKHIAVAPERVAIDHFSDQIKQAGYDHTKEIIRIKWNQQVDYALLGNMIEFNIKDKADCSTFWRK